MNFFIKHSLLVLVESTLLTSTSFCMSFNCFRKPQKNFIIKTPLTSQVETCPQKTILEQETEEVIAIEQKYVNTKEKALSMTKLLYEILYKDTHLKCTDKAIEIVKIAQDNLDEELFELFINTYFYQNVFNQFFLEVTPPDKYSCSLFWFALQRNKKVARAILNAALTRLNNESFWHFINNRFDGDTILTSQVACKNNTMTESIIGAISKRLDPGHFDAFLKAKNKEGQTAAQITEDIENIPAKKIFDQAIAWNNLRIALAYSKKEQIAQRTIRAYTQAQNTARWKAINQLSAQVNNIAQTVEDTLEVEALE